MRRLQYATVANSVLAGPDSGRTLLWLSLILTEPDKRPYLMTDVPDNGRAS